MKCNEGFTKGLPENFANKKHVKHTSTVLEPSIPFHTLVELVYAQDIAIDKIRTHDLALEVNNIKKQQQTQTLGSSQQEHLMFTQPRDPSNKNKPTYKIIVPRVTEHTTQSPLVSKNKEMMKIKEMKSPQKSFVQYFRSLQTTEQNNMIHFIEVEVIHGTIITIKILIHKTDIALHPEIDLVMTKVLPLHNHDMTTINEIHDLVALLTDLLHDTRQRYGSRSYSRDNNNFTRYTSSYRPPSRPREARFSRSRSHSNTRNKLNAIQPQHQNDPINFEVHMYHPTEMANAVTLTSWFYYLDTHTPPNQFQRDCPSRLEISFLLDSGVSLSV